MPIQIPTIPSLLTRPTELCPRCAGQRIRLLVVRSESGFSWRDCGGCGYLWALPHEWTSPVREQGDMLVGN